MMQAGPAGPVSFFAPAASSLLYSGDKFAILAEEKTGPSARCGHGARERMRAMDRCALAYDYHKKGYNCAQAVAAAFEDLTGWTKERLFAAAGSFGGGFGGSHEEACGALSGALLVLGLLFPFTEEGDQEAKRRVYGLAKDFRQRFFGVFGYTRCGDLLRARPGVTEKNPASVRLGVTAHCDNMIVTAVELLEALLREQGKL